MWRREWIWQAYRSVTMRSIAVGVVTTILRCSSLGFALLVKTRLILADDVLFHLPCARAHVHKIDVNLRCVVHPPGILLEASTPQLTNATRSIIFIVVMGRRMPKTFSFITRTPT